MSVMVMGLGGYLTTVTAQAATSAGPFYTAADALANAPQGTPMSGYFSFAKNSSVSTNSASVVSADSPVDGLTNSAVQITPNSQQKTGAVWSTKESFNLYKDETASMWIFASGAEGATPGDGMAFVLQNAGDTNQFSSSGESLGVWGVDPKSTTESTAALANTAIPRSWALEFDTYKNNTTPVSTLFSPWNVDDGAPSSFELGSAYQRVDTSGPIGVSVPIGGAHIASNYPGEPSTYQALGPIRGYSTSKLNIGDYYYYGMTHLGFIPVGTSLADYKWHHVTLNYQAPTAAGGNGTMTYSYDDKNPQTGLSQTAAATRTVPIDLGKFDLASGQKSIRWGFTGSTGTSSENNIVLFDQIPGQTKTTAASTMTYEKDGQQVAVAGGDSIPGGSNVTLNYQASRISGDADWEGVNAEVKVPDHVALDGTAKVTYDNGDTRNVTISKQSDGYAKVKLAQDDSDAGLTLSGTQAVKISVGGKTVNPSSGSTYSSGSDLTSYFEGSNAVSTTATPAFTITYADIPILSVKLDQTMYRINPGEDTVVTGSITTTDGSTLKNSNLSLEPAFFVPGNTTSGYLVTPFTLSDSNPASKFTYTFASNTLYAATGPGVYTLKLDVRDSSTSQLIHATPITIIIGDVDFGSNSGDLTFASELSGTEKLVQRADPDWSFNINDTVKQGTNWKLYAKASALTTEAGTPLDGQLTYVDGDGEHDLSPTADTLIMDHQSAGNGEPVDVAKSWTTDSGILLKLHSGAVKGDYKGKIDWTLKDAP